MEIKTVSILPTEIKMSFDIYLLNPMYGIFIRVQDKLIPYANRKIRYQDVGKRRDFDKYLAKFYEVYERKKIEKANYDEKIKNANERSSLSNTGETTRLRRYQNPR